MSLIQNNEILIKLGYCGVPSIGDNEWDEASYGSVKHILITHGDVINSIQVAYETKGNLILAHRHGGDGDRFDCINLESWEVLDTVKGYYGPTRGNNLSVVRSLTFCTNRATYGPFGREEGTPFSFNVRSGVSFSGFHGRCNSSYLCAIGIYVKTTAKYHFVPNPVRYKNVPGLCAASEK